MKDEAEVMSADGGGVGERPESSLVHPSSFTLHPSRLSVRVVADATALAALAPAWSELLADSAANEPTLSPAWLLAWWEVFGSIGDRRLRAVVFHEGDRLVGLAPLLARRCWHVPGLPFRRLEPLGCGEPEAEAICSDYLNVVARRGREAAVARALVGLLAGGPDLGPWDELVVPMMDGSGVMPGLLAEAGRERGLLVTLTVTGEAPYIPLPASWEAYLAQLQKKDRYTVNRSLRDFDAWADGTAELRCAATPEELQAGKRALIDLHHQRWQGTPSGVFRAPRFLAFHDRVMPTLLREGALELLVLSVRAEPVAAMYNIVWAGKTSFYQSGRRLDLPRHLRPGGVIVYHAIRRAIEAGRREFDFLGGADLYKKQLAPGARPLVQLRLARRGLVERLRAAAEWCRPAARAVRGWLRRRAPRRDSATD
jgi:CelD/BcsL family acetyltransferase involved in cellulose biosynthesis